jgi:hypothetical protein
MAITPSNDILDGYFYTFIYKARENSLEVDESPLIFCIGPSLKNENNFIGLNLHKLSEQMREALIIGMQKRKGILNSVSRAIFSPIELNSILPGCISAIREYSRKRVFYSQRIDSTDIYLYIYGDGKERVVRNAPKYKRISERWNGLINNKL